uniref:SCP domain-containing protein n=1 Tax=Pristionchus pacificus TaxID=54126 RepID=A0A2A6BSB3_PRIPA|eukprot:PDM68829.1 hypothetical protein PRIPAC_47131 [Pristionchus pacificus]
MNSDQVQILDDHNHYRAKHGAQALRLDGNLNSSAQAWAQHLAWQDSGLPHSSGNYGENLFCCGGTAATDATHLWYNEVSMYNFHTGGYSTATGHFTALVWRGTSSLGVGIAQSGSGRTYVVAHYYPPGNHAGQFQQNVRPAQNGVAAQQNGAANNHQQSASAQLDGQKFVRSHYGAYLRAWRGPNCGPNWLVDMAPHCKECEHWHIEDHGGKVVFRAYCSPAKYLRANQDGSVDLAGHAQAWEMWTPVRNANGTWSFRSHHGTWLRAQPNGVVSLQTHAKADEQFTIGAW